MNFDDLPKNVSDEEFREIAVERFRHLRSVIYAVLPEDCLLKPNHVLTGKMVEALNADIVEGGFVQREDICALCVEKRCPYYKVDNKSGRLLKIIALQNFGKVQ